MALYRVERPFSSRPVELPQGLLGEVLHDFTHYVVMELSDEGVVSLENAGLSARLISSRQGLSIAGYDFDPASLSERAQIGLADQVVSDDEGQAREQSVFIAQFFSFFPERWSQVISEHGLTAIEYFGDSAYLVLGDLDRTMSLARSRSC